MFYLLSKYCGPKVARALFLLIGTGCFGFLGYLVVKGTNGIGVVLLALAGIWCLYLALRSSRKESPADNANRDN
jgi:putative Mn2+ efflux pump MntP